MENNRYEKMSKKAYRFLFITFIVYLNASLKSYHNPEEVLLLASGFEVHFDFLWTGHFCFACGETGKIVQCGSWHRWDCCSKK